MRPIRHYASRANVLTGQAGYEHPRFDFSYCPPIPAGWREFSWHNDAMPCWQVHTEAGPLVVWVDYFTKDLGNFPDVDWWKRYAVVTADPPPPDHPEWGVQHAMVDAQVLAYTDDWEEVLRVVAECG